MDTESEGSISIFHEAESSADRNAPSEATLLDSYDVFSLIVNKMIGTGIYTAPPSVLLLTGSKQLALGLWGLGFVYTIMSALIYLDYAVVFPYTGGEIVYVNEITSANSLYPENTTPANTRHKNEASADDNASPQSRNQAARLFFGRIFGDGLLAYIIYAFLFVGVFNSATNALQIGREVLISISPNQNPNRHLVRFIGIVAFTIICLIQLFSSRAGRSLNSIFAFIKILFILVLLCFGFAAIHRNKSPVEFTHKLSGVAALNYAQAIMVVLFSYAGWENANFVAGEISTSNPRILRKGFIWAVAVVGVLYMAVNAVFLTAIPYSDLVEFRNAGKQFNYPAMFSNNRIGAQRAWAIIIALSAAGNANTVMYTYTRVKQSIGQANVLPWSSIWKKDYSPHGRPIGDRYKTPAGGLLLEWIGMIVLVGASAVIPGTMESVQLPGNIQTYCQCCLVVILGLGTFRLRKRETDLGISIAPSWFPRISRAHWLCKICFVGLYMSLNLFILVINASSNYSAIDNPKATFRGRYFPAIIFSIVGLGVLYYCMVFAAYVPRPFWNWSLLRLANTECEIIKKPKFDMENEEARRFGHRRIISIRLKSPVPYWQSVLFWIFGGEIDPSPIELIEEHRGEMYPKVMAKISWLKNVFRTSQRPSERSPDGADDN